MSSTIFSRRQFVAGGAAAVAAAAGAVGLGSCSSSSSSSSSDEVTTINFWCHTNEPWIKSYETVIEKFVADNPEYEVVLTDYPYEEYGSKIQTTLTSNDGEVDVIAVWGGDAPAYIESDALAAVPSELEEDIRDDYLEPCIGVYEKDGALYGVSMELNLAAGALLVNKTLFDEAGLDYPTTWEEMRSISKQVAVKNGDVMEMRGFDIIDTDALIGNYLAMIRQQGADFLTDDQSIDLTTEASVTAFKEIMSTVTEGETNTDCLTSGDYCYADLYEGTCYMSGQAPWVLGEGTDTYGLTEGVDFEYVDLPRFVDGAGMKLVSETGWGLMVPSGSQNQDAAWKFIEYFVQPDVLVEHNVACSQLPPRESLLDNETYLEGMSSISFMMEELGDVEWMGPYNTSTWREILNAKFIELCDSDDPDVEAALAEVTEQVNSEARISYSA